MDSITGKIISSASSVRPLRVAVIGGSIGGLAAATAFIRLGASVDIFEKSETSFAARGSSLGFCAVDMWQTLTGRRMIRRGKQASRAQGAFLYGDLWAYLAEGIPDGVIRYGQNITDLGDDTMHPIVNGEPFDLAIVADGTWSVLRKRHFTPDLPLYAGWQAWRLRVPLDLVPGWDSEGEYNTKNYSTILMRIAKNDGTDWIMGGTSIACPESDITQPEEGTNRHAGGMELETPGTPAWFLDFFRSEYGHIDGGELCRAMEAAAKFGKITPNPQYEFAAKQVVKGRIVLVGDAAHTAVPRTAAGAHTAVLDGLGLFEAFRTFLTTTPAGGAGAKTDAWTAAVEKGLAAYDAPAVKRARELYNRSLEVTKPVLPPGWSSEAARIPMTPERAATLTVVQLKAELMARRISFAGLKEKAEFVAALLGAVPAK